jgi:DNA-directed RNA polymerase subunit H (RpoH/RPB5)
VTEVVKKARIVISLVKESTETPNEEIAKEILKELSTRPTKIPWMKNVEKVTVTDE